jgi:integrase
MSKVADNDELERLRQLLAPAREEKPSRLKKIMAKFSKRKPKYGRRSKKKRSLGDGQQWIFRSRANTPVNLGNARRRYLHPTAAAIGVNVGGWHDFRHTLTRMMRRAGVDPIVRRDTLGHSKVEQQEVYDLARRTEVGNALRLVGRQLEPNVEPNQSIQ